MPIDSSREPDRDESGRLAAIAVTADGEMATLWAAALREANIEADVRIGDARTLLPASTLASAGGPVDAMFAYTVLVPVASREQAAQALSEVGWNGHARTYGTDPSTGVMLRGALIALAAGAVVVLLVVARLADGS